MLQQIAEAMLAARAASLEQNESLSGQNEVALAPRGPVAGTVDVVKT
jgi:hypothetical protein